MLYIVIATQYVLCFLSMLLTALFCVDVAYSSAALESMRMLSMVAMLIAGIGFDLSKYIFWYFHSKSKGYLVNCLVLVVFSWSASVAFFMSSQQTNIEAARTKTTSYKAHELEVNSLKVQIRQKTYVLENRLNSQYHEQWDKAELLSDEVKQLENKLKELVKVQEHIGYMEVLNNEQFGTTSLFLYLASLFDLSYKSVAFLAYAVLALLIESCSLGVISLSSMIKHQPISATRKKRHSKNQKPPNQKKTISEKMLALRHAIVSGEIDPVIRRIKKSHYHLSEDNIRKVLTEMKGEGLLVDGPKCLRLANKPTR